MLITDAHADAPIGIAGIKGGKSAEVTSATIDLIIESANFDGTTTRRAAQSLKLFTEASARFQNRPSPELVAYGMRDVLALITEIAGGEVEGVVDVYPPTRGGRGADQSVGSNQDKGVPVTVSLTQINDILGSDFSRTDVDNVFRRLTLPYRYENNTWMVTPPFERTDLNIPEDLVEEVGRIMGYDLIAPILLPAPATAPDQRRFRGIERMKDMLVEQGFIEVSTQSFAEKGDIMLANPLDTTKPALRTSLEENLGEALVRANRYAPLVLAPNEKPRLFEVGTVFPNPPAGGGEYLELRMTETAWEGVPTHDNLTVAKLEDYGKDYAPKRYELGAYKPFSIYPFIVRDIALWVPAGTKAESIEKIIRENAGLLLVRLDQFDTFQKGEKVSYAFRLVFESPERTLTDEEVNGVMKGVGDALTTAGYEVR